MPCPRLCIKPIYKASNSDAGASMKRPDLIFGSTDARVLEEPGEVRLEDVCDATLERMQETLW